MVITGIQSRSFTTRFKGFSNVLANKVSVATAYDSNDPAQLKSSIDSAVEFTGVWDTGATNSVITQKVVDDCSLISTGIAEVSTAQGSHRTPTFLVSIILPNQVSYTDVRVSMGMLAGNADVLIGMDIIGTGDFAVTNFGGRTMFSFRTPSVETIDFTGRVAAQSNLRKVGRNEKCPCGSGKKYKRCHGGIQVA